MGIDLTNSNDTTDTLIWPLTDKGDLTVKSVYEYLINDLAHPNNSISTLNPVWDHIWYLDVLPRIKVFVWKAYNGILPASFTMHRLVQAIDPICSLCTSEPETELHSLLNCQFSRAVWIRIGCRIDRNIGSIEQWIKTWIDNNKSSPVGNVKWSQLFYLTAWYIWKARCNKCFHNISPSPAVTIGLIHDHIGTYRTNASSYTLYRTPNPSQLTNSQIHLSKQSLVMLCYSKWKVHLIKAIVVIVITDEEGTIKGQHAFYCDVGTIEESVTLGALTAMKWHHQLKNRICNIEMKNKKIVKKLRSKWKHLEQPSNITMLDDNVDLFCYFKLFNCNSLRQDWQRKLKAIGCTYATSSGDDSGPLFPDCSTFQRYKANQAKPLND